MEKFCWNFLSPTLSEEKKGDYGIVSDRSFVLPFIRTKLRRHRNSTTTGPIHSKSSSLELSWLVDVHRNAHLPIRPLEPCSQGGGPSSGLLVLGCDFFFQNLGCVFSRTNTISHISGMIGSIDVKWKKEVRRLDTGWTVWPQPLTSPMTLTLDISRSNFETVVSQELLV